MSDTFKTESVELVKILHKLNIKTVMLTGDNSLTAKYIAKQLGIDEVISGCCRKKKLVRFKITKKKIKWLLW